MIIFLKDGSIQESDNLAILKGSDFKNILYVKITSSDQHRVNEIAEFFNIDLNMFRNREDIEISSHYIDLSNQLTLNLNIPVDLTSKLITEESIHFVVKDEMVFIFTSEKIDTIIEQLTKLRYDQETLKLTSHLEYLTFQLGTISDYYADMVELISNQIRFTYYELINNTFVSDNKLDLLSQYNFSNFLLRESVSEFQRIILLLRRKYSTNNLITEKLDLEIHDLHVISEHIQYNFERVNDLKSNINSKIELEQNKIFKTLTIITVCVSLPTLIAGIYGMNFKNMPELNFNYGYPIVAILILASFVLPLIYFKRKKWF